MKNGKSLRQIATVLGRSPSTISREIRRNWSKKAKRCHRKNNLTKNPAAFAFVLEKLLQFWSPEIIAGRWNKDHSNKISLRSIYRAVRAGDFPGVKASTHFHRKGKLHANQKKSYTRFFDSSIHDREEIVDLRGRLGDFEGDTVYGSVGKGYLVTAVDRRSRFTVAAIAPDKTIESTNAAFFEAFRRENLFDPLTLTLDNDTEFLGFKELERAAGLKVYFADPHAPWQRGSNENVNGLIRFFFPRGTDFTNVSDLQLTSVLHLINHRPRKRLGFLPPYEVVLQLLHLD